MSNDTANTIYARRPKWLPADKWEQIKTATIERIEQWIADLATDHDPGWSDCPAWCSLCTGVVDVGGPMVHHETTLVAEGFERPPVLLYANQSMDGGIDELGIDVRVSVEDMSAERARSLAAVLVAAADALDGVGL